MFNNEVTWFFIAVAVVLSVLILAQERGKREEEYTKQVTIQLQIEMVKAGVTNAPAIKIP